MDSQTWISSFLSFYFKTSLKTQYVHLLRTATHLMLPGGSPASTIGRAIAMLRPDVLDAATEAKQIQEESQGGTRYQLWEHHSMKDLLVLSVALQTTVKQTSTWEKASIIVLEALQKAVEGTEFEALRDEEAVYLAIKTEVKNEQRIKNLEATIANLTKIIESQAESTVNSKHGETQ